VLHPALKNDDPAPQGVYVNASPPGAEEAQLAPIFLGPVRIEVAEHGDCAVGAAGGAVAVAHVRRAGTLRHTG
jgi:hypothetical protein